MQRPLGLAVPVCWRSSKAVGVRGRGSQGPLEDWLMLELTKVSEAGLGAEQGCGLPQEARSWTLAL